MRGAHTDRLRLAISDVGKGACPLVAANTPLHHRYLRYVIVSVSIVVDIDNKTIASDNGA